MTGVQTCALPIYVAVLTGSENIGVESDIELSKQLDTVLDKFDVDGTIIVTDGVEDEYILPIIESKTNVIALKRVVVKQAQRLESTYYVLLDFLKDIANDPKLSRLFIGLPAIAFVLYAILGQHGWRLIVGVIGVFLLIKGFGLEGHVDKFITELKSSFKSGKISSLTYVVAALIGLLGFINGIDVYLTALREPAIETGFRSINLFIAGSIDYITIAAMVALIGKIIDALMERRKAGKYIVTGVFVISFYIIADAIIKEMGLATLALRIIIGLSLSLFAILAKRSAKKRRKRIVKSKPETA